MLAPISTLQTIGSDLKLLCLALRTSPADLRKAVCSTRDYCKQVIVVRRRRSQLPRVTWETQDPVRRLQRQLALWLKATHDNLGPHVTGFKGGSSPLKNALFHIGPANSVVVTADIESFFDSISLWDIVDVLEQLGASKQVAIALARFNTIGDRLMQGGRASPYIANFVATRLDQIVLANLPMGCSYSRYVDDLTFSGSANVIPSEAVVSQWIEMDGFRPRVKSIRTFLRAGGPYVTGLHVGGERPALPRRFRRRMEAFLHFAEKFDIETAAKRTLRKSVEDALQFFCGACNWAESIDSTKVKLWRDRLSQRVAPTTE
jgi:hypothetical protein